MMLGYGKGKSYEKESDYFENNRKKDDTVYRNEYE